MNVDTPTILDRGSRSVERGVLVANHEHGNLGAVIALIPYLVCQKPASSGKACDFCLAPDFPRTTRLPSTWLRKVITSDGTGCVKTGQRNKEKWLLAPPVCSKGADVIRCQALQLSATLEIMDVEFVLDIALVSSHQPIVTQDRHILQMCIFVFSYEVLAKTLDRNGPRLRSVTESFDVDSDDFILRSIDIGMEVELGSVVSDAIMA